MQQIQKAIMKKVTKKVTNPPPYMKALFNEQIKRRPISIKARIAILQDELKTFKKELEKIDRTRSYCEFPFLTDSGSCCGVKELTDGGSGFLRGEGTKLDILLALSDCFQGTFGLLVKYYNSWDEGKEVFKVLLELGWECTRKFYNPNSGKTLYELTGEYGMRNQRI